MLNVNTDEWNKNSLVMQRSFLARAHRNKLIRLSRFYDLVRNKESAILDLGCGSGYFIRDFYNKGYRNLYGVEPDAKLMANIPPAGIADVRIEYAAKMSFSDSSFDAVFVYGVMHHLVSVEDYIIASAEIHRVLKPGGVVFVMEPARFWAMKCMYTAVNLLSSFSTTLSALAKALEEEHDNIQCFVLNHKTIREHFLSMNYRPLVDKYFFYSWVFTSQKPYYT